MFFRRKKPVVLSFDDRLTALKEAGFAVRQNGSATEALKHGCAATIADSGPDSPAVSKAGVVIGNEIGYLVNGGYQQFFVTPSARKFPALAQQLRALHDFMEDLKEALGLDSLYNTSLGTTSDKHLYDRVEDRDRGIHKDFENGQ